MSFSFQENEKNYLEKIAAFRQMFSKIGVTAQGQYVLDTRIEENSGRLNENTFECIRDTSKIKYMEIELTQTNPDTRQSLAPKVRKYKVDFQSNKKKFMELELGFQEYDQKLASQMNSSQIKGQDKLIHTTNQMIGQTFQLQELNQVGYQTEKAAIHISEALGNQQKLILDAIDDADEINRDVGLTNRQIQMMKNKEVFNKLILVAIIIVLSIGNLMLLYYRIST